MKLGEITIADFVKAGWTPEDIKIIAGLAEKENVGKQPETAQPPQLPNEPQSQSQSQNNGSDNDIAERLKQLEEQNKQLAEQLKAAQAANTSRDNSGNYTEVNPLEQLVELFRKN